MSLYYNRCLFYRAKPSFLAREEIRATKFKLKKKEKSKKSDTADEIKSRTKVLDRFEEYGKILYGPRIEKPQRTLEELEEAQRMSLMWKKNMDRLDRESNKKETYRIEMRKLATEELPTDALKTAASTNDLSPFPSDFIYPMVNPPREEWDIFGTMISTGKTVLLKK